MEYLTVRIISPKQVVFQGQAVSISSTNSAGNFDILPKHANFITLVEKSPIIIRKTDGKNVQYSFPIAIIYNENNLVNIYTDIELPQSIV